MSGRPKNKKQANALKRILTDNWFDENSHCPASPCSVSFVRRPMLISGMLAKGTGPEEGSHKVLVNSEDTAEEQAITLWHEMIHFIRLAGGLPEQYHDEKEIEAVAQKIATVCPEIVEWAFPPQNSKDVDASRPKS